MIFLRSWITLLFLLLMGGVSAADPLPENWEGFRYAAKVKLPFQQFLKDSVVIIETAGVFGRRAASDAPDEWVDVAAVKPPRHGVKLPDKRRFQIETCRRAGIARCPVMKRTTYGTGFILNGDTLVTCRHGFHNWMAWAAQGNGLSLDGMAVPLRLRNDAGKIIYDSSRAKPEEMLRLSFFNPDLRINVPVDASADYPNPRMAFNAKASDYAELKSPRPLTPAHAPPLRGAARGVSAGEALFLFGYPDPVRGYAGGRVSGKRLAGSHGFVIDLIPERGAVRTSNYSNHGMSGAPLITAGGEIAGLSCGAFGLDKKASRPGDVNATGIVMDEGALLDLWSRLTY